ncbi:hypothetical protein HOLleu_37784 [Holothuria leucospilota]|uniref:Uncharacterized protein n=1 Tax=Holothuria leucospilota TaxID=206669 RepID=A0A9Q1BCM5_HOLLE|nr:hypothetical protein HOLleu_37784 [Holothuria leucospilota]
MEYVGKITEEAGVRLAVHPRDILPHPEEVGFSVAPGFSTSIGIRQVELKRLGYPYGGCSNGENTNYLSSDRFNYSIISCQKKCLLDYMADRCGCVDNIYDDYEHVPKCQRKNLNQCEALMFLPKKIIAYYLTITAYYRTENPRLTRI